MKRGLIWGIIIGTIIIIGFGIFIFSNSNDKPTEGLCIYGCKATYESRAISIQYAGHGENLYLYDLNKKEKILINPSPSDISHVGIDSENKDKIFYMDNRKGKHNDTLYIYDLTTKKEQEISNFNLKRINLNSINDLGKVIVSGSMVYFIKNVYPATLPSIDIGDQTKVWQHLFSYNIGTDEEIKLTDTDLPRSCVSKDNKNIIYIENGSLVLYDLDSRERFIIESQVDDHKSQMGFVTREYCPSIYNGKAVYSLSNMKSNGLPMTNLYLYDLNKKEKIILGKIQQPSSKHSNTYLGQLDLKEKELKYRTTKETLVILDDYEQTFSCTSVDLNSLKTKDLSCEGGIGSLLEVQDEEEGYVFPVK